MKSTAPPCDASTRHPTQRCSDARTVCSQGRGIGQNGPVEQQPSRKEWEVGRASALPTVCLWHCRTNRLRGALCDILWGPNILWAQRLRNAMPSTSSTSMCTRTDTWSWLLRCRRPRRRRVEAWVSWAQRLSGAMMQQQQQSGRQRQTECGAVVVPMWHFNPSWDSCCYGRHDLNFLNMHEPR